MLEHPLYTPKSVFKRCKNLPVNLVERYDLGWIVWEQFENLPTLWIFYQKDKSLTIKTQSGTQTLSWDYLKESCLLLLYKNKNSEPEAYEIYETKDRQYLKLKNVANEQVFYLVHEVAIDADMREYLLTFSIDVLLGKDYSNYPTHILTEAKIAKKTMALGCLVHAIILVASAFTVESLVTLVFLVSPFTYLFGTPAYTSKRINELRAKQNFSSFGLKKIQENYSGFTYLVLRFAIGFVGFFVLFIFAYGYLFYNQR